MLHVQMSFFSVIQAVCFTKYDVHAVNQMQRNIKLVSYRKYDNNLLLLEHLNTLAVKPIVENNVNDGNMKSSTQKSHVEKLAAVSDDLKNLYYVICDFIESLGDDIVSNQHKLYLESSIDFPLCAC